MAVTAAAIVRVLSAMDIPLTERLGQLLDVTIVLVVAAAVTGEDDAQGMVEVVIPLGVEAESSELTRTNDAGIIEGALGDAIDPPVELLGARPERQAQFLKEGLSRVIEDGMDGVKAQRVDLELRDPEQGVVDEEASNLI